MYRSILPEISSTDLTDKVLFDTPETKETDRHLVLDNMNRTKVSFQARLGAARIPFRDILNLETGDIIKLDTEISDHIYAFAQNKNLYKASIGKVGKRYGVKIHKILKGDDEDE